MTATVSDTIVIAWQVTTGDCVVYVETRPSYGVDGVTRSVFAITYEVKKQLVYNCEEEKSEVGVSDQFAIEAV